MKTMKLLFLFLLGVLPMQAQDSEEGCFEGTVTNQDGNPVSDDMQKRHSSGRLRPRSIMRKIILFFLSCILVVSCDFIIPNRLLVQVNGEDFTKIPVKKGEAFAGSYWKGGNIHYRLQIGFFLRGKKFSVQPLSLGLIPSSSSITVVPDSNNGIFESKNYDISNTIFTKVIRAEQFFDITYTSLINNDTVSFKIPPSDLLLLDGEPILKDTITITFPKLNDFGSDNTVVY